MDFAKFFNDLEILVDAGETTVKDAVVTWDALVNVINDAKSEFINLFNKPKAAVVDCVAECRALVEAHKTGKLQAAAPGAINWLAILLLVKKIIDIITGS